MAGGKVHNWKHGWIPVSPAAKAFVAGRGPKPTAKDATRPGSSPNERKYGIPSARVKDDRAGGEKRARAISELVPGIGTVSPFYRGESQDMPGHYTGGVRTSHQQSITLVNHLEKTDPKSTGGDYADDLMREQMRQARAARPNGRAAALDLANRVAAIVPELKPSGRIGRPEPYYSTKPEFSGHGSQRYYDGGLTFSPEQSDALINYISDSVHGGDDRRKIGY